MSDALVIVVSEETGAISLGERGRLQRWLSVDSLRKELRSRLVEDAHEEQIKVPDEIADAHEPVEAA